MKAGTRTGLPFQGHGGSSNSELFQLQVPCKSKHHRIGKIFTLNSCVDLNLKRVGETFGPSSRKPVYTGMMDVFLVTVWWRYFWNVSYWNDKRWLVAVQGFEPRTLRIWVWTQRTSPILSDSNPLWINPPASGRRGRSLQGEQWIERYLSKDFQVSLNSSNIKRSWFLQKLLDKIMLL
jgi:hypothetical protein